VTRSEHEGANRTFPTAIISMIATRLPTAASGTGGDPTMTHTPTRRLRLWLAVGALLAPATVLAAATPSSAALPNHCTYDVPGPGVTCKYTANDTFTVPTPVTSIDITATGGAGGKNFTGVPGGAGAQARTTGVAVTPGNALIIRVGGSGSTRTPGNNGAGSNLGGAGGSLGAGGGGGYTEVTGPGLVLIAGGGGGAGANAGTNTGGSGGDAGTAAVGQPGAQSSGGTLGGAAGTGAAAVPIAGTAGGAATPGGGGGGGAGASTTAAMGGAASAVNAGGGGGAGRSQGPGGTTFSPAGDPPSVLIQYVPCVTDASVSIGNAQVIEGNAGTNNLKIPIAVNNPSGCTGVTVNLAIVGGTATPGVDYIVPALTPVVIPAGSTGVDVTIKVKGDTDVEPNETIFVKIVSVSSPDASDPADLPKITDGFAVGTILNDDDEIPYCAPGVAPPMGYNVITGDNGPNKLIGTPGPDIIYGLGGDDVILGGRGADILCGGSGRDEILGGPGKDQISGGPGNDKLLGGAGHDTIFGGTGRNEIHQ
jgi:hypothetical protein